MKTKYFIGLLASCLYILLHGQAYAQKAEKGNFWEAINAYDCSKLWRDDSVQNLSVVDDSLYFDPSKFAFPVPLGYIGDKFQRFYIYFSEIIKDNTDLNVYRVAGKIKVGDNICPFTGTFTIEKASITSDKSLPVPVRKRGTLRCFCKIYEDSSHAGSGTIQGEMITDFCLYKGGVIYDNIGSVADGYCNNQFTGTWVSYITKHKRTCNWGNHRIPGSGGFDIGAGEFSPSDEFSKYGWQSYRDAYGGPESKKQSEALKEENRKWWE